MWKTFGGPLKPHVSGRYGEAGAALASAGDVQGAVQLWLRGGRARRAAALILQHPFLLRDNELVEAVHAQLIKVRFRPPHKRAQMQRRQSNILFWWSYRKNGGRWLVRFRSGEVTVEPPWITTLRAITTREQYNLQKRYLSLSYIVIVLFFHVIHTRHFLPSSW